MFVQLYWCSFNCIGVRSTVLVFVQQYWCSFNCIGVRSTLLVFVQLYWCSFNCIGVRSTVLVFVQLYWCSFVGDDLRSVHLSEPVLLKLQSGSMGSVGMFRPKVNKGEKCIKFRGHDKV